MWMLVGWLAGAFGFMMGQAGSILLTTLSRSVRTAGVKTSFQVFLSLKSDARPF
jgi:hypothetical protein